MVEVPLSQRKCQPCEGGVKPLNAQEATKYVETVQGWLLNNNSTGIFRIFRMKNFMAAVKFIQLIAEVAESENHHPDIHLTGYRNLRVELSTHAIDGLSENDFILAAKINELPAELKN